MQQTNLRNMFQYLYTISAVHDLLLKVGHLLEKYLYSKSLWVLYLCNILVHLGHMRHILCLFMEHGKRRKRNVWLIQWRFHTPKTPVTFLRQIRCIT